MNTSINICCTILRIASGLFALLILVLCSATNSMAQQCAYATPMQFQCSDSETHCSQMILLRTCSGSGSPYCCTTNGYFSPCCGIPYQNSQNEYPCGDSHCSTGGDVVDPTTGRISRACFGSAGSKAQTKELPKVRSKPTSTQNAQTGR